MNDSTDLDLEASRRRPDDEIVGDAERVVKLAHPDGEGKAAGVRRAAADDECSDTFLSESLQRHLPTDTTLGQVTTSTEPRTTHKHATFAHCENHQCILNSAEKKNSIEE